MFGNFSKTSRFIGVYKWLWKVLVTCDTFQLRYFVDKSLIFGYMQDKG